MLIMEGIAATLRNTVALLLVWMMISGSNMNPSQTEAIPASPHPFFVQQYGETVTLKIKGDEHDHWVTDKYGKHNTFGAMFIYINLIIVAAAVAVAIAVHTVLYILHSAIRQMNYECITRAKIISTLTSSMTFYFTA